MPHIQRRAELTDVRGTDLDLLIANFARFINSDVALCYRLAGKGKPPTVICSWGLGAAQEQVARLGKGGFVGRALGAQRAALEPLYPLLDSSLTFATTPRLRHAAAAPVRLPTGIVGGLIAGFVQLPQDAALALWKAESYAALMALFLQDPERWMDCFPQCPATTSPAPWPTRPDRDALRYELPVGRGRRDRSGPSVNHPARAPRNRR